MTSHKLAARSSTSLRLRPLLCMKKLSSSSSKPFFVTGISVISEVTDIGEDGTAALAEGRGRGRGRGGIFKLMRLNA